ncbi:hypothetical protein Ga0080574_TMP3743 [Salipiger abyssi]|uniref:Uncharacterized protein n=1 Tax=Salipiger abyssi TaxID=1250539 RepID=A0A1P8UXG1_9RHOB|nr:hypothetical protein Ga0080574_TMP3743 [Salipiger abyssi]
MSQTASQISHGRVLKIALPILLSNVTIPILGAVDTGVVGQIPQPEPIAAVGIGAIVLTAIYWVFGFLRMGTVGLAAQAAGMGDRAEVSALLTRALAIGLAGGLALIALQWAIFAVAFAVSPASAEVEALARGYMRIRIWSAPAAIAIYGVTGWLIAQERTRGVFVLQLWMNAINVALDLLFVLGLGWASRAWRWPPSSPSGRGSPWGSGSAARRCAIRRRAPGRGSSTGRGCGAWRWSMAIS